MVVHETLTGLLGPFLIPVVLFIFGGVVYIVLWWLGHAGPGEDQAQR